MNILGCFKIVSDFEQLQERDWVPDEELQIETGFARTTWSCFDESALALMLRARKFPDCVGRLDALTVGGDECAAYIKTLYSLGFDTVTQVDAKMRQSFTVDITAEIIAQHLRKKDYSMVIMGGQSSDENNAKTHFMVAERMAWPCICDVIDFSLQSHDTIIVSNIQFGNAATRTVRLPCVLAVGNAPNAYLRIPTLKAKLQFGNRSATKLHYKDFALSKSTEPELISLERIDRKRAAIALNEDSLQALVQRIYQDYIEKE